MGDITRKSWLAILMIVAGCGRSNNANDDLAAVRKAELALAGTYDRVKASDPDRAELLRSQCSTKYDPDWQYAIRECVVEHFDQPNSSGATVVSVPVNDYDYGTVDFGQAETKLFQSDALKYGRLKTECERRYNPSGQSAVEINSEVNHCVIERWAG